MKIKLKRNGTITTYYVMTNMQGDVESIYDSSGNLQARYDYDSWGNTYKVIDAGGNEITDINHIGNINPIRYRGYNLQSRYYDSNIGRFVSTDDINYLWSQFICILHK